MPFFDWKLVKIVSLSRMYQVIAIKSAKKSVEIDCRCILAKNIIGIKIRNSCLNFQNLKKIIVKLKVIKIYLGSTN